MKKILAYLFLLILFVALFVLWQVFGPSVNATKKYLYIPTGSTYQQVKDSLKKNNFLDGFFWFDQVAKFAGYPDKVKAGKYEITKNMSRYNLVKMLRSGMQAPVNLVITKIRTKEDLARRIGRSFETDSAQAIRYFNQPDSIKQFGVDTASVLTAVIPNTYTYYWTTPVHEIFEKLVREQKKFWNEERVSKARQHGLSPKQVYILASIVEEETNEQEDKGKIASVYINRMRKGMRLAADPTVKYAMRDFELRRIYHKHLAYESPFNTYRNDGLPPGPICTPSIKTIDAVLDAPETDYLFFVARADLSGHSDFANSYDQHLVYARAYQKALDSLQAARETKSKSPN